MSEELTWCVRGCVSPCTCTECLIADKPTHPPQRREAYEGLLCKRCATNLARMIREIPDLYATLDVVPEAIGMGEGVKHAGISGSPALARLDIVALMDPRTAATDSSGDDWDGSAYIPNEVGTWALLLAEEHRVTSRIGTMYEATRFLTDWMPELCASPWVDECHDALRDVERLLKRAHGDRKTTPAVTRRCINVYERGGETIECGAVIRVESATESIRCRTCGRRYEGYSLVALKVG